MGEDNTERRNSARSIGGGKAITERGEAPWFGDSGWGRRRKTGVSVGTGLVATSDRLGLFVLDVRRWP